MDDLAIRPVSRADYAAITAIYGDAVCHGTGSFETDPPGVAEMARRLTALDDGGYPGLVAVTAGRVVGFAYAGPHHTRAGYRNTVEDSVYVGRDMRGKGVGGLLLAALIVACEAGGFRQMVAVIGDSANAASVRLHEAAGFRHVGAFTGIGYKHGRWLDVVLMQRPLGHGSAAPPVR